MTNKQVLEALEPNLPRGEYAEGKLFLFIVVDQKTAEISLATNLEHDKDIPKFLNDVRTDISRNIQK